MNITQVTWVSPEWREGDQVEAVRWDEGLSNVFRDAELQPSWGELFSSPVMATCTLWG